MISIQVNHFFQRIDLEKIIWNTKQPWDKDGTSNNDIVILKLKSPLKFNDNVQPACLPDVASFDKARANKQMAALSGWGLLKDKSKLNTKLTLIMLVGGNNLVEMEYLHHLDFAQALDTGSGGRFFFND